MKSKDTQMQRFEGYAAWATDKLISLYFNPTVRVFNNQYPHQEDPNANNNFWWKAHAVDSMTDAYERTQDTYYMDMAKLAVRMNIAVNGGLLNEFIDDMQWFGLANLRIWDITGEEEFLNNTHRLWEDIKTVWWDDEVGGFGWKRGQLYSRNACSNGPAAILAARMYQRFNDPADLEYAKKAYNFVRDYLKCPKGGHIWDGLKVLENGELEINKKWIFTYNAGTFIGAAVELFRITGDRQYLNDAEAVTAGSVSYFLDPATQIFKECGMGDGGLFRGILIRYWVQLFMETRNPRIREVINANAEQVRYKVAGDLGLFGPSWQAPCTTPVDLSTQLSGHFLFEAAAKLEKLGSM